MITCERAVELAGQAELSGEALAARWHVQHCPQCQRALSVLWTQVATLDERLAWQKLLDVDLEDAVCQVGKQATAWLARGTRQMLAVAVQLREPLAPSLPARGLATLGDSAAPEQRVIRQSVEQSPDGSLEYKITFIADLAHLEQCTAEVEVNIFDRWDLAGVDVFLLWINDQRRGQTDGQGRVRFMSIPVAVLDQLDVIIRPPQMPISTNGAQ
jgi:hypothetical protein